MDQGGWEGEAGALWEEATLPAPWENRLHPGIEALATGPPGEGLGSGPRP